MARSSNMNIDITATDKASRVIKGVGSTADKVGRGMGSRMGMAFAGIGTAAAVAGAAIAVDFGKQSVSAFMDAEKSQARFEQSLAKNNLKPYTADITALAESLALKTRFDDDATKSGAAILANFGLTGKELQKVIPLVQDYAAFTGTDLDSASKKVGKAFLGNTKALKDLGIAYKPTGDKAKDMAAIQDLLNQKVGGFASKEGKTAAGQASILGNQFGELQETVGGWLVPALSALAGWIIEHVIPAIQTAAQWIGDNLGPVVQRLGEWITTTAVPALKNLADGFMENVWPAIQQVAGMIAENLQPVIEALQQFWTDTLLPAMEKMWPIVQKIGTILGGLIAVVAVVVSWLVGKLVPIFLRIAGFIAPIVIGAIGLIVDAVLWIANAAKTTWENVSKWFGNMVGFVKGLPGKVTSAVSGLWDGIKDSFRSALNWVISAWNNFRIQFPSFDFDWNGPLPGGEVTVGGWTVNTPNIPMLAKGGTAIAPGLALVGENGPELLSMNRGASVIPLDRAGSGGTHFHIGTLIAGPGWQRQLAAAVDDAVASGAYRPKAI